ncbi:MAG: hypothetical protein NC339_01815 [Muribaculaceae bacterium]|nr:hypothetical protein [Muribaculaceae bacterium]
MADNYLERRMDDYRSGRLSSRKSIGRIGSLTANSLILRYPKMNVLVYGDAKLKTLEPLLEALRGVGISVAFCSPNDKESVDLARRTGSRLYPSNFSPEDIMSDLKHHWGRVDVVLTFADVNYFQGEKVLRLDYPEGVDLNTISRAVVFMLHPENEWMLSQQSSFIHQVP